MIKTSLTSEEIQKMIDQSLYLRDKVVLSFLADVGCRVSELLGLKVEQIDLDNRQAMIRHLKRGIKKKCPECGRGAGRNTKFCSKCGHNLSRVTAEGMEERSRLISFGSATAELLAEYIKYLNPDSYLISLGRVQIYNIVRNAARSIGIKGKALLNPESGKKHYVHPHNFRDALAIDWLNYAGSDVSLQKALQEHLGHLSFDTTMRYAKLNPAMVRGITDEVRKARFK